MASDSTVKVSFLGDASHLKKATDAAHGHLGNIASGIGDLAKKAAIGFAAIGAGAAVFAKSAISAASDLAESQGKVSVVFGEQAKEIEAWAATASTAFGQSKQQALEAAGTYGNLFQAFGVGRKESATMSKSLVELAADLASFNNTSVDDALLALRSGLSGETEPLKRFGIAVNDARLKEEALRLGLIKTTKDALTPGAKAQAAYALIMKDSALAQGDFARTSDGLANRTRILKARFADIQAEIGTKLLPVAVALAGFMLNTLGPAFAKISSFVGKAVGAFKEAFTAQSTLGEWEAHGVIEQLGVVAAKVFGWIKENVPPILQAIGGFIKTEVIPAIQSLAKWVRDDLGPAFGKLAKSFKEEIWPVLEEKVIPALKKLATFIKDEVLPILGKVVVFIVGELIPALFKVINWISTEAIPAIARFVERVYGIVKPWIEVAASIAMTIADIIVKLWNFAFEVKEFVFDVRDNLWAIGEAIWAPFKWAFDKIQQAWDNSIGKIVDKLGSVGGFVGGAVGKIPGFATGGMVGGPVGVPRLAVVHGGEQVLTPAQQRMGGGGGQSIVLNIDGRSFMTWLVDYSRDAGGIPITTRAAS